MNKIFNLTSQFKAHEEEDGTVKIRGYASTNDTDRTGDVIEATAWEKGGLKNYQDNPIILFNHNYNEPIGKTTDLHTTDRGLEINGLISKSAGKIRDMVKEGVLGAFSVGFRVKDAEHIEETDGLRIKDAELFEVSVVSVPANQAAVFSVTKSFDSEEEYTAWKAQFIHDPQKSGQSEEDSPKETANAVFEEKVMSDLENFNLEEFAKEVARKTAAEIAMAHAERESAKEAKEEEEKATSDAQKAAEEQKLDEKKAEVEAVVQGVTTGAERLINDVEERVSKNHEDLESVVNELRSELAEKSEEIQGIRESKRIFSNRASESDWKDAYEEEIADAYMLARITGKGYDTELGKDVLQKVNEHSGVQVPSSWFETEVSSNIERDIQLELVLAPMFREVQMRSASQILPIMPDAGYAEFQVVNQTASGSSPHGNLTERGDANAAPYGGADLTEISISTRKLISQSYLGNETEEDAIIPILPLIREAVIRSHARSVEAMILIGNHADGPFPVHATNGSPNGILQIANALSHRTQDTAPFATATLSDAKASKLLEARGQMGKYGLRPTDVVYIINLRGYHELIADSAYADSSQVEGLATKLTGQVGQVYGSPVIVSDEFATPGTDGFAAVAVNTRNYIVPRLRGITVESDYEVANQRRVLVATQRIGFSTIIASAHSAHIVQYAGS